MSAQIAKKQDTGLTRQRAEAAVTQIQAMLPKFKLVLPPHVQPERFARVCITAITQDADLLKCTPKSILEACLTAAQLGLEPNKQIGEGYFIAFFDGKEGLHKCQWMTGYRGYLALARNSGEVSVIDAQVVYKDDEFEYEYGLNAKLRHIPSQAERKDDDITHAWAMVKYKDGSYGFKVLTRADIEKRRAVSKVKNGGPWKDWYGQMCIKTAIRALSNYLPKSVQKALQIDNAADRGEYSRIDADNGDFILDIPEGEAEEAPEAPAQLEARTSSRLDNFAGETVAAEVVTE